jgi:transposase
MINERNQTPMSKTVQYIGLDVHKETIAVAIAPANTVEVRHYGIIGGTLEAVDKLLKKLASENIELRLVYEAGPCGYVIARHLRSKGLHCDVVSPSLIPKKASDRIKTDRRDAEQLARLYRAGELTAIHVPDQEDEAMREATEHLMEEMAERVKRHRAIMKSRKALVEHPFGTIKRGMGMGYFLCKGLESVRAEMSLTVLAYNLKRVLNILSFAELMNAVTAKA